MADEVKIHPSADVQSVLIGARTRIWQNVVVLPGASLGADVNICAHCFIENDVQIGNRVTVKSGVYLWDGVRLEDDVFVGPNATFTNDKHPRSKAYPSAFERTLVESGASIGAGAVLLPGIVVGRGAMVGAGAVVTSTVPPFAIVTGSPARIVGYVDDAASRQTSGEGIVHDSTSAPSAAVSRIGVGDATIHRMKLVRDMRGDLSVGEFLTDVPFEAKRYFLVFGVPSEKTRGQHAHRLCHQFLICVKGSCHVVVDDGRSRAEMTLDSPATGLHIPPMTWGIQYKYTHDAVLLVFASHPYDGGDYIRDYAEFLTLSREHRAGG